MGFAGDERGGKQDARRQKHTDNAILRDNHSCPSDVTFIVSHILSGLHVFRFNFLLPVSYWLRGGRGGRRKPNIQRVRRSTSVEFMQLDHLLGVDDRIYEGPSLTSGAHGDAA